MAKISGIKTTVSAPAEINISLIRADYHETANVFRVFFEIFLSLFSATLGALLAMPQRPIIYFVVLVVCMLLGAVCLKFTYSYSRSSSANDKDAADTQTPL